MTTKTLYESYHPRIVITHDTDTGEIVLNREDRYMRNTEGATPAFVPEYIVLLTTESE